jgi:hypothetical protein
VTNYRFSSAWRYDGGDPSIKLFDRAVKAGWFELPQGARVLELGCCETDFSRYLLEADPTIQLTGVDVNVPQDFLGTFHRGDAASVTDIRFGRGVFEAVIILGALEHFGLGYYGDPKHDHADVTTMHRVSEWLVPGGWCYYDVPWTPVYGGHYVTENRHFRVYDDDSITRLDATGRLRPVRRMYAHGETDAYQATRPTVPITPFWYLQRLVEKEA